MVSPDREGLSSRGSIFSSSAPRARLPGYTTDGSGTKPGNQLTPSGAVDSFRADAGESERRRVGMSPRRHRERAPSSTRAPVDHRVTSSGRIHRLAEALIEKRL